MPLPFPSPEFDKTQWGEGPWLKEPDQIAWVEPETGLDCCVLRGPQGQLNGYVGVSMIHRVYGLRYDHEYLDAINVHNSLTWSNRGDDPDDGVWWFGFHAGGSWDLSPGRAGDHDTCLEGASYKDLIYVVRETVKLAKQLAQIDKVLQPVSP